MIKNVIGLIGWPAGWVAVLALTPYGAKWPAWILVPYSLYGFYRLTIQFRYFPAAFRMRRVLQTYPWQILSGVPSGLGKHEDAQDDGIWFEFRHPADAEVRVPLTFVEHYRQYWWMRRMDGPRTKPQRRAHIEPLWFAGDPRFVAVIAAPAAGGKAPKRLHLLYQPFFYDTRRTPELRGATREDIERARCAGGRSLVDVPQPGMQG